MNCSHPKSQLILLLGAVALAGCVQTEQTADQPVRPAANQFRESSVEVSGQILVTDAGKIQPTGLAPVWIFDATNVQLTAKIPLPDFGGRSRMDWQRVVTAYPKSLDVYAAQAQLQALGPQLEVKRIAATREYLDQQAALNGRTSGPEFDAVTRLQAEAARLLAEENAAWDGADDLRDLIVFWYNLNPGTLYVSGLPAPLATAQTDKSGHFSFRLPAWKNVLVAAHIEGTIAGKPGRYFWLLPFNADNSPTNMLALSGDNAAARLEKAQLARIILPETNGFLGEVGFWMLNRVRDDRAGH